MKFLSAIGVYTAAGLALMTGIVLATHGTFWLLILGAVSFLLAFAKFGCLGH